MAVFSIPHVRMSGITAAVPGHIEANNGLSGFSPEELELLIRTTGIDTRRVAPSDVCASDLCYEAAVRLMEGLNWLPEEVDALVFVTQTPDYQLPGNSMLLQDRLGLSGNCLTLDIHQGCAGYVYGLSALAGLMSASGLKKGLLLVGDTITRLLDPLDKGTIPIFSDAGTATALVFDTGAAPLQFNLQTNGAKSDAIRMEGSGSRKQDGDAFMRMRGHDIFTFGLKEVAPNIEKLLAFSEVAAEEIDYFVLHQANMLLNESIRKKLRVPAEKVPYTLQSYGNTSCATVPLTLVETLARQEVAGNLQWILSGFGVGLSWGSVYAKTGKIWSCPVIEVHGAN